MSSVLSLLYPGNCDHLSSGQAYGLVGACQWLTGKGITTDVITSLISHLSTARCIAFLTRVSSNGGTSLLKKTVQIAVLEGSPTWNLFGCLAASCQVSTLPFHAKSV